mmetsp:Transcript_825/g.2051  ORF Transcript_825/g.2051 Transcript_825/m.2051 type:complete len:164 (+) Transcript_825:150-641(+)
MRTWKLLQDHASEADAIGLIGNASCSRSVQVKGDILCGNSGLRGPSPVAQAVGNVGNSMGTRGDVRLRGAFLHAGADLSPAGNAPAAQSFRKVAGPRRDILNEGDFLTVGIVLELMGMLSTGQDRSCRPRSSPQEKPMEDATQEEAGHAAPPQGQYDVEDVAI